MLQQQQVRPLSLLKFLFLNFPLLAFHADATWNVSFPPLCQQMRENFSSHSHELERAVSANSAVIVIDRHRQ